MEKNTDMVPSPNSLKLYMMVNGKMVCTMDMVCSNILMELFIMEIGRMVKNMDMVFFPSPTVIVTKENGKMIILWERRPLINYDPIHINKK